MTFKLHHLAIICSDYPRSKDFYTRVLGLTIVRETYRAERSSYKLDLALADGSQIELFSFPSPPIRVTRPEACGLRHLALAVPDLDAELDRLASLGVTSEPVRVDELTGARFTFFADPDGLPIELYETQSPAHNLRGASREPEVIVESLPQEVTDDDLDALAALLVDAVEAGAAVSFLQPLAHHTARAWWEKCLAERHPKAAVLIARDPATRTILGTAQLQPAWAPNQPHRAEVCKVLVSSAAKRRGIASRLMLELEHVARASGFSLLTLDARAGGPAERLYRAMGWEFVGTIPDYAIDADGQGRHATVIFYKRV